jgi:pantoate--beta-alanine ligase
MRTIDSITEMVEIRNQIKRPMALVPTMGALHHGHISLIDKAKEENASVIVSIFINPTQFGPKEDFQSYPRELESDLSILKSLDIDVVFMPNQDDMYPNGFETWVEVRGIGDRLEGEQRPGHFRGVATVVTKLFAITRPDTAYFGQKDAQQVVVIGKLNRDLNLGVDLKALPTIREPDGLAMSTRNFYMEAHERQASSVIFRSLALAHDMYFKGYRNSNEIKDEIRTLIEEEPLARINYISIAQIDTLEEIEHINNHALISVAVNIGQTRLIDNITVGPATKLLQ